MTGFDLLHPVVQHHVVNTLGWPALRPLQDEAIEPVLARRRTHSCSHRLRAARPRRRSSRC